jgi:hypothetical protein
MKQEKEKTRYRVDVVLTSDERITREAYVSSMRYAVPPFFSRVEEVLISLDEKTNPETEEIVRYIKKTQEQQDEINTLKKTIRDFQEAQKKVMEAQCQTSST